MIRGRGLLDSRGKGNEVYSLRSGKRPVVYSVGTRMV